MSNSVFFSLQKKLLALVLSATLISISITTILFLNFDNIPLFEMQENIIWIGLTLMFGLSIITYFLSKRLSEPITKLSDAANKITQGDFSVRTNIKSRDEIGYLSSSFDSMAQKLQESLIEIKGQKNIIKQQEDILLQFSEHSEKYCVGIIDIINSTKICANLSDSEISEFYKIFLNSIASIIKRFEGTVVKNLGDGLLFYFAIHDIEDKTTLKKCLDCCLELAEAHNEITKKLKEQNLPLIDYRTSITYGLVRIAKTSTSSVNDIFGITVNRCAKINKSSPTNGVIIGQGLYDLVKEFEGYLFKKIESNTVSLEYGYVGYVVSKNSEN
jgi:class 3 adenylate cyclase/HAMP domain-containing protein